MEIPEEFSGTREPAEQSATRSSSFVFKPLGALAAAGATIHWAWKMDRSALLVTLAGTSVAIVAVTAMSQFHLLSHF